MLCLDYEKINQIVDEIALTSILVMTPRLDPRPCPLRPLLILDLDLNLARCLTRTTPHRPRLAHHHLERHPQDLLVMQRRVVDRLGLGQVGSRSRLH